MQYISLKVIADNISNNPLLLDVSLDRIVNYAVQLIRLVGMPAIFAEKTATVDIENHRGILPCDILEVLQIRNKYQLCYTETTDTFFMSDKERCDASQYLTYKIQGNYIYTSAKTDILEIAYQSMLLDEDGFPLIPDNSSFIEALEAFIKERHYNNLLDQGKISALSYQIALLKYSWYVGQALSDLVRLSIDQLENLTAMFNRLLPNIREHSRGFKTLGVTNNLNTY